jgi:hypothetical protein
MSSNKIIIIASSLVFLTSLFFGRQLLIDGKLFKRRGEMKKMKEVCFLTPVYEGHFSILATRLLMTKHYSLEPVPPHFVVFTDQNEVDLFCHLFENVCLLPWLRKPILLSDLLGKDFERLMKFTSSIQDGTKTNIGGCTALPKTYILGLKRSLGVASLENICSTVVMMDAESLPFRNFNLTDLIQFSLNKPFHVMSSWYNDRWGCTQYIGPSDPYCTYVNAVELNLSAFDLSSSEMWSQKKSFQNGIMSNFWQLHDPVLYKKAIRYAETVTNMTFFDFFITKMAPNDFVFYSSLAQYFAEEEHPLISILNLPEEVERSFPDAFSACLHCEKSNVDHTSQDIEHLYANDCFRALVSLSSIGKFLIERLGMFSIFGDKIRAFPNEFSELVRAESRISWCHSNCILDITISGSFKKAGIPYGKEFWENVTKVDLSPLFEGKIKLLPS